MFKNCVYENLGLLGFVERGIVVVWSLRMDLIGLNFYLSRIVTFSIFLIGKIYNFSKVMSLE